MEFIKAIEICKRMCQTYDKNKLKGDCYDICPLSHRNNGTQAECIAMIIDHTEKTEKILEKWNQEHPQKTIRDNFFELFPNAPHKDGTPYVCVANLYESVKCISNDNCKECWSRSIEEVIEEVNE